MGKEKRLEFCLDNTDELEGRGKLTDDKNDNGGLTKTGLTQGAYDSHRAKKGLPLQSVALCEEAERLEIFKEAYYNPMKIDLLSTDEQALALYQFGVNSGTALAIMKVQEALGITADGLMGPATAAALDCLGPQGSVELIFKAQTARYRAIVVSSNFKLKMWHDQGKGQNDGAPQPRDQRANIVGWLNRVDRTARMVKHAFRVDEETRLWARGQNADYTLTKIPA